MSENQKIEKMDLSKLRVGVEEISVSESFVVDIEAGLSHLRERDTNANSKFSISHSRKGTPRGGGEKKIIPTAAATAAVEASTRASLHGGSTTEKPVAVAHMAADHAVSPRIHHQITIKKESLSSPPPASQHDGKRFGYRRSSSGRFIDPRRVLVFFATLSSMGTVLLIYFTLSIGKLNRDDNGLT